MLGFDAHGSTLREIAFGARNERWDAWIDVHCDREFQHPSACNAVAAVRLPEAAGEGASDRLLCGTPDAAFRRQRPCTVDGIRRGATPMTPLCGGLDDLDLAMCRIEALPARPERDA